MLSSHKKLFHAQYVKYPSRISIKSRVYLAQGNEQNSVSFLYSMRECCFFKDERMLFLKMLQLKKT